jgi:hypothetical protein
MGNHTPTPWEVLDTHFGPKIYTVQGNGAAVCQFFPFHEKGRNPTDAFLNADANAALIVRAVNAHAQLVAALEKIAKGTEDTHYPFRSLPPGEMKRIARDALASLKESAS